MNPLFRLKMWGIHKAYEAGIKRGEKVAEKKLRAMFRIGQAKRTEEVLEQLPIANVQPVQLALPPPILHLPPGEWTRQWRRTHPSALQEARLPIDRIPTQDITPPRRRVTSVLAPIPMPMPCAVPPDDTSWLVSGPPPQIDMEETAKMKATVRLLHQRS